MTRTAPRTSSPPSPRPARRLLRALGALGLLALAGVLVTDARGDSVVQFMTAKSLPDATVDVIDPESGTSTGGGEGSDVNLAPGDIILFRFSVGSAPASAVRGIQAYITEYVPPGTELVGVRIVDEHNLTIEPRRAGLALDGCGGGVECVNFNNAPCPGGTCAFPSGSIAQVYADTGVFFSTDPRLDPVPDNAFLTLKNGILMDPEPRFIDPEIVQLLKDTSGTYYAHNLWDWHQVLAYGTQTSSVTGGRGNTPFRYGSPVAGPDTYYDYEATHNGTRSELANVVGPWERIYYPGSQIGTGAPNIGSTNNMTRVGVDTVAGWDLTPATPVAARAVRFALGEAQVGENRYVEVALRVLSTPIDPSFGALGLGGNVDCGEAFGSDISNKSANTGGRNNPWASYVGHPQCVFLRLKLDLTVDRVLAGGGTHLNYLIDGKNLAIESEHNARIRLKYVGSDQAFVGATPPPDQTFACPPPENNKTCLQWNLGTLAPADEFLIETTLSVGGQGAGTNVVEAQYLSDELLAIDPRGYTTTAMTVVQPAAAPVLVLSNALDPTASFAPVDSNTWQVTGTLSNVGTTNWTQSDLTLHLPAGWRVHNGQVTVGGATFNCTGTGCATQSTQQFPIALTYTPLQQRAVSFRVVVPAGTPHALYTLDALTRGSQGVFGSFESAFWKAVTIPVGKVRTQKPVLQCQPPMNTPIGSSVTSIYGTSEPDAAVDLLFNLIERDDTVADAAGDWVASDFLPAFGELYGGLEVRAVATAPNKLPSELADACFVTTTRACSDGIDNDGDGLIDFPADPGCTSLADNSEEDAATPQCRDGIDNDGNGLADWPEDPSCSSPDDDLEDGVPACRDGIDNDGDGLIDFPDDPDCTDPDDATEQFLRACQDGVDNDGDGLIDFPDDPGCHSAFDDDEFDGGMSTLDTKARLLIAFDTSGSMNWHTCADVFTGGDGSTECPGIDVACNACGNPTCDNDEADDSRLFQVKSGLSNVVAAFGEVEYALMRFHQRGVPFRCAGSNASLRSGGWQGGGAAPCSGGFAAGDVLVRYAFDNEPTILDWMNHDSDYPGGEPPAGSDFELRGSGTTPLAGILTSAGDYLDDVRAGDLKVACRPYKVVLVTDGAETCGGDPTAAAAALLADGIPVYVIGFSTSDAQVTANLDAIAAAGGTVRAILVDDEVSLSAEMARIVEESILVERCNGLDDDCDGVADEDFPDLGEACSNGEQGVCHETGVRVCASNQLTTVCDAPPGTPGDELCNGLDDDCDGLIDEELGPQCFCVPTPEICNNIDDDCDGEVDEGDLPGVGDTCGLSIGACEPGALACVSGVLTCEGGTGPTVETCNGVDDDCDTFVDEVVEVCYEFDTGCTIPGGCTGTCRTGIRTCDGLELGACVGQVGPVDELCNGLDDDCDGAIDEGLGLGDACDNGLLGACNAPGVIVCDGLGGTMCTAPPVPPGIEVCNDIDDDCDGEVDEELGPPIGTMCGGGGACSVGTFECRDGAIVCVGSETGAPEVCNGIDDDCDGIVDEDVPGTGAPCVPPGFEEYGDTGRCELGTTECIGGVLDCRGYVGPIQEIPCNGIDEDCDGEDDVTCPGDQACLQDGCRNPCEDGEFPCPFGFVCETHPGGRFCVPDPCADVQCDPGFACDPATGGCRDLCEGVTCPTGLSCRNGICQDCFATGCPDGELCVRDPQTNLGECTTDLCAGVECPAGEACQNGTCVATSCSPACAFGQICQNGTCIDHPCGGPCPVGQVCNPDTGECRPDRCANRQCQIGEACNPHTGECIADPCAQIMCSPGTVCTILPDDSAICQSKDVPPEEKVFAGGGGCACGAGGDAGGGLLLAAFALAGALRRRRRARR